MKSRWLLKPVAGGVLAAKGFVGGVAACGIKSGQPSREDLVLVASEWPCTAAGVFTRNLIQAAPVKLSKIHLARARHRGVVLNSGNANACTGPAGLEAAYAMASAAAARLGCAPEEVLVCSTGRIGVPLPVERILHGLQTLSLSRRHAAACARAIMTSDTVPKQAACRMCLGEQSFTVGAMAKGAGMIRPDMATMLCVITTDAAAPKAALQQALAVAADGTFNRITVDGDMSTNDTVLAFANGASGVRPPAEALRQALEHVCARLARAIVLDGEGVSRLVEVSVAGAETLADARRAAEAVANSTLVKCAWAGGDPNWGRIMDALGYSGARVEENRVEIDYGGLPIVRGGQLAPTPWKKLQAVAARREFQVEIRLGLGTATWKILTTDLTETYVRLNLGE